jgi:hypothetical protein
MTRTTSFTVRTALGLLTAAALGACDAPQQALGPTLPDDGPSRAAGVMYGRFKTGALVICNVNMAGLTVQCGSSQQPFGSPVVIGGEGTHVRLLPSSVSYNAGTDVLQIFMRIQDLLVNQIGTKDGPTITGLNAFFASPPFVTGGSGSVSVTNADGTANFTAPNQKYYFYNEKIGMLQTTANKVWLFNVPGTVTSFRFGVYVSAEILPVIFFDKTVGGNRDIWRVALDGTDLVQVTTNAAADLDPSVGVRTVVFTSYRNGNADIYKIPINGGAETRLTTSMANEMQPALRFDELAIAYVSDATGVTRLWKMLPNGTGHAPLTSGFGTAAAVEANPFFNPAKNIIFTTTNSGVSADLFIYKPTKIEGMITEPSGDVEGVVTTDGKNVIFTSDRHGDTELYIYSLVSKTTTRVTNRVGLDYQPTVGPTVGAAPYQIVYTSADPTPVLKWKTVAGAATVIPTGAGSPANPSFLLAY